MAGWICLHRDIQEHWLFNFDEPDKYMAWTDLLLSANHEDRKFMIKGQVVECKRGQVAMSQVTLSKRWKWSRPKVQRFLELLKNDGMISVSGDHLTTIISICNYSVYQGNSAADVTPDVTGDVTPDVTGDVTQTTIKQLNKKDCTVLAEGASQQKTQLSGEDKPTQGMQWVEYFVNERGFQIHEAQNAKTVPMFNNWVTLEVSYADVEIALHSANHVLNGERPANPMYYRRFVEQVMLEKQKSQRNPTRSSSGLTEPNNRANYDAKHGKTETYASSGRKLSLVEQAAQSTARVEARELQQDCVVG